MRAPRLVRRSLLLVPLVVATLPVPLTARAAPPDPAARIGPVDRVELEAFLDGLMEAELADRHIAGAVVAVVRDGRLLLSKGYGFADLARRAPVDPARTLFRIGSVSKLFTWTTVMQLVEQGKLDLDADVNRYLDFRIRDTYPEPVTLRNLLTHTAGFEDDNRGMQVYDPADIEPLGVWLRTHQPARVRPPGTYSSYSNYGAGLAGYIVQRVSGQPFEAYLEEHLLRPLGMTHTTGRQPLPAALAGDLSDGYAWSDGRFVPQPFELVSGVTPAASMSSTAGDMARWMLAHLNDGELDGARILEPETAEAMHAHQFGADPRITGWGLGFYEQSSHGLQIIGHGGGSEWFHTNLSLIPSERLGLFVSFNTETGALLALGRFLDLFLDHYYPAAAPPRVAMGGLDRFAGTYQFNRRSFTSFQKALTLTSAVTIGALGDSALLVSLPFGEAQYVPVDSMLFAEKQGSMRLAFRADSSGRVTHGFLSLTPFMVLDRQPWYALPLLHLAILGGGLAVFLGVLLTAAGRWMRRRETLAAAPRTLARGRLVLGLAALANLGFAALFALAMSDQVSLMSDSPRLLNVALALPLAALALVLAGAWIGVRLRRERAVSAGARWRHWAVVVVGLAFGWSLWFWNLLGWRG